MKILIAFTAALLGGQTLSYVDLLEDQWNSFKITYGKKYLSETEEDFRMKIFANNFHKIETHNRRYELGLVSYKLSMNHFGDLLHREFLDIYTDFNKYESFDPHNAIWEDNKREKFNASDYTWIPEGWDWQFLGCARVKDQGPCGSSWSFSTTGALESHHYIAKSEMLRFSEQNLIDCSTPYGNRGCDGGSVNASYLYIMNNHGINTEESYPYEARQGKCRYDPKSPGITIKGFVDLQSKNETELTIAIAAVGAISVVIDASQDTFQFYGGGIYDEPQCSQDNLTLAVLATGYDKDSFSVKNSWGTAWGEHGFMRMSRNKNNQCGIATRATYPLV